MKESLINKVKHSYIFGWIYVQIMSLIYRILDFLIIPNEKQIIFSSFSGRQVSDSPKAVYEAIKEDTRFSDYKLIWAVRDTRKFEFIPTEEKISINAIYFFIVLFQSKYWVSNASIERLIPINSKKHVYINSWHGVPLKHLGVDEKKLEFPVKNWYKKVEFDLLTASGKYDGELFKRIFPSTTNIRRIGLPRNELLVKQMLDSINIKKRLLEELNLDEHKKILLYAPTFREYSLTINEHTNGFFDEKFIEELSNKYNILVRGHYFANSDDLNGSVIDVSDYQDLNALMIASDLLVTDYSSIMFDYMLLEKDIILYMYDFEEYYTYRGMYFDPRDSGLVACTDIRGLRTVLEKKEHTDYKNLEQFNNLESPTATIVDYILEN